jgi:hypothetical protein
MRTACSPMAEPQGSLRCVRAGKVPGMRAVFVFYSLVIVAGLIVAVFVALAQP